MKHRILFVITIFLLIPSVALLAQDRNRNTDNQKRLNLENLKAKRIAYFTKEIGLTKEESEEFWTVFNELEEKRFEINRGMRQEIRKIREAERTGKNVLDAEYEKLINVILDSKEKEASIEREYVKKMRKVLSPEKVFKYQRAEYKFAREAFAPSSPVRSSRR